MSPELGDFKMARILQKWSPVVHQDILISILDVLKPTASQYNSIVDDLQAKGHKFTVGALT